MAICPACKGMRIRDDYKPAPLPLRLFGVRALLCDYCNHQFRAFSPLSPKSRKPRSFERKADIFNEAPGVDLNQLDLATPQLKKSVESMVGAAPAIQLKTNVDETGAPPPVKAPLEALAQGAAEQTGQANQPHPQMDQVKQPDPPNHPGGPLIERLQTGAPPRDLKTEVINLQTHASPKPKHEKPEPLRPLPNCPECGSPDIRRRHRTAIERAALSLTQHKAYACRACKASFYAKPAEPVTTNSLADA